MVYPNPLVSPVGNGASTGTGDGSPINGGLFPALQVTSLQFVNGNINTTTGLPDPTTSDNLLVASTYGQGDFAIRLNNANVEAVGSVASTAVVNLQGPQVVSIVPTTSGTLSATLNGFIVTFAGPVDPHSVSTSDVSVLDPLGHVVAVLSVTDITPNPPPGTGNMHNVYSVTFSNPQSLVGNYHVVLTGFSDNAGDVMTPYTTNVLFPATPTLVIDVAGQGVQAYSPTTGFVQLKTADASVIATDGLGNVVAEFPGQGVQLYQSGKGWIPLGTPYASLLAMDGKGDVFAEFPGAGLWRFTIGAGWSQLTPSNASHMSVNANGDMVAEFPGFGVWLSNASGWTSLGAPAGAPTDASLVGIDSNDDVFANYPGSGVYFYTLANKSWTKATSFNASLLAVDANGDFAINVPGTGVERFLAIHSGSLLNGYQTPTNLTGNQANQLTMDRVGDLFAAFPNGGVSMAGAGASAFTPLTTGNATVIGANAGGDTSVSSDLAAQLTSLGLERFDVATRTWNAFHPAAVGVNPATVFAANANGDTVAEFPNSGGATSNVWLYRDSTGWVELPLPVAGATDASQVSIDAVGNVVAEFSNHGVWRYTVAGGWQFLTGSNASVLVTDANGDVAAEFPGAGLWQITNAGGWSQLTGSNASLLAEDANGNLVADFPGFGLWRHTASGWQFLTPSEASLLVEDANGNIAANFPGSGIYVLTLTVGWVPFQQTGPFATANASVLVEEASGVLVAGFASNTGNALEQYTTAGGVSLLTTAPGNGLSALAGSAGGPSIIADDLVTIRSTGVWRYEDATGFVQLPNPTGANTPTLVAIDLAGDVAANFSAGASAGVYLYRDSTGWQLVNSNQATLLGIDGVGDVVAEQPGRGGLFRYSAASPGGLFLTGSVASQLSVAYNGTIVAEFPGAGVWRFKDTTGWVQLTSVDATTLAVNFNGVVAAEFKTVEPASGVGTGVSVFNTASKWVRAATDVNAKMLAIDGYNNIAVVDTTGPGLTVYAAGNLTPHVLDSTTTILAMDALGDVVVFIPGTGVKRYRGLSPTYGVAVPLDSDTTTTQLEA